MNKGVGRLHAPQQSATHCGDVDFQAIVSTVNCWTVRKQVHCVESRMEYYWVLCSKNAQNTNVSTIPTLRIY